MQISRQQGEPEPKEEPLDEASLPRQPTKPHPNPKIRELQFWELLNKVTVKSKAV